MVQRRPPLPRTLRALCAVLPVAGLLVPLAAAPAVPATLRGAGTQRPIGPDPAVNLPAHGNLTMAANSVPTCDDSDGSPCNDTEGGNNHTRLDDTATLDLKGSRTRRAQTRTSNTVAPALTADTRLANTATVPSPSPSTSAGPSPSASPSPHPSGAPRPVPGPGTNGRLPETGSAGALPLVGLAALGCVLAGLMVLATKSRRRR
ncbi:hypothetical protein [Kitasatospora sp. NPDC004272]